MFYWNMDTPIHLCVVCGCFYTTVKELSVCNGDYMAGKDQNIYSLALYRKSLPITPLTY